MNVSVDSALASTLAPWLPVVDAVLKATAVLILTGAISIAFRRASAATRHLLWTLGLLAALVLPALSLALPKWQLPLLSVATPAPALSAAGSAHVAPVADRSVERGAPALRPEAHDARRDTSKASSRQPVTRLPAPAHPSESSRTPTVGAILIAVWAAGALAILGRLALGLLAVQWISRRTDRVTAAAWLPLARQLADEIGAPPSLTFLRSPRATMPMAWGIVRPSVLMPADADTWPDDRLRIVLLHELAHVKRRDCLTHALAQVACAVYWFNPLAWIAARHLRTERERACDDLVLAAGTRGSDYAAQLIEVARVMRSGRFPALLTGATLAMAHRSQLEGRLIAILDPRVPRAGLTRARAAGATAAVACALVPLASIQPWAYTATPQEVRHERSSPARSAAADAAAARAAQAPRPTPQPKPVPAESIAEGVARAALSIVATAANDPEVQDAIRGAVKSVAEAAIQGIAEANTSSSAGEAQERKAADPRTVAALTAALKDVDAEVRRTAMQALVELRDPSIFEPLVQALRDASADIREHAAMGLGQLRDPRAIQPLTQALKDERASVREQAVFALGELRAKESAVAIAQALKDESTSVREQAAFALGQIRDRRAVAALSTALSDSSDSVREQAVFALGQLRDPAAVDALVTMLRDERPDVREQAAFALGQIRDARSVVPLVAALKDANAEVREQAAFALGQMRDRGAVEGLIGALKDQNPDVRSQAAFALGQLRDPRAIDALTAALKDANSEVRQQAAFALGQLAR